MKLKNIKHLAHYLAQKNHPINAVIVAVVIHGLWGEGEEFQSLEERLIVSLQIENELIEKTGAPALIREDKNVSK